MSSAQLLRLRPARIQMPQSVPGVPCAALPVPASCGPISGAGLLPVAVSLTHICLSWSLVSLVGCLVCLFVLSKALKPHSLPEFSYLISINSGTRKGFYLRRTIDI